MSAICVLDDIAPRFPQTNNALLEPNGLLAVGGNLKPKTLIEAYSRGIFPWFNDDQPILWWSPTPRLALDPADLHIGRSLRKAAKKRLFQISVDTAFPEVITQCSDVERDGQDGTWINDDIIDAYCQLHELGYAHSIEAWHQGQLAGGLYGIALGGVFFGESMFSSISGASKQAFVTLVLQLRHWGFNLIDCQVQTQYLMSFGAKEISRENFEKRLKKGVSAEMDIHWKKDWAMSEYGYEGLDEPS